jgi:hypothetical protein
VTGVLLFVGISLAVALGFVFASEWFTRALDRLWGAE